MQDKISLITTKEDFVEFLSDLRNDLLNRPDEWENPTLERFLDAMAAWVDAIQICSEHTGNKELLYPSWKTFAEILYAAKIYE